VANALFPKNIGQSKKNGKNLGFFQKLLQTGKRIWYNYCVLLYAKKGEISLGNAKFSKL